MKSVLGHSTLDEVAPIRSPTRRRGAVMSENRTKTETRTAGRTGHIPSPRRPAERPLNDGTRGLLGKHEHPAATTPRRAAVPAQAGRA